jgi:hypothetical protein
MSVRISTISLILLVLLSTGCKKVYDYIDKNPNATCDACRITEATVHYDPDPYDGLPAVLVIKHTFSYDEKDRLISVTAPFGIAGNYDRYYRYDNKDRLTDFMITFNEAKGVLVWHHYKYLSNKKILDSVLTYAGLITDPNPPYGKFPSGEYYNNITLDNFDRVVEIVNQKVNYTTNFSYDKTGNLVLPNAVYDNKINPYRTSTSLQFTLWDYSANNAIARPGDEDIVFPVITKYNEYGLPVTYVKSVRSPLHLYTLGLIYDTLDVKYDCDLSKIKY